MSDLVKDLRIVASIERMAFAAEKRAELLLKAADRIEMLETELAVCREAIEVCLDVVENLPSDDDGAAAVKRCTLRRLNEAIGKAVPRLMRERPEGQKMYGLNYIEMRQRIEADCTAMQQALDALELCRLNSSQYLYGNERDIVFSAIKTLRKQL